MKVLKKLTSISQKALLPRDNSNVYFTAPPSVYNQATNCGNTSNSHNVNHTENYYNMTEDPLRDFGRLECSDVVCFAKLCRP